MACRHAVKRPVILVTGPDKGGTTAWLFTRLAIYLAGGRAVRATPSSPFHGKYHGLILGGGADIDPDRWFHHEEKERPFHPETELAQTQRPWLSLLISLLLYPVRHMLSLKEGSGLDKKRDSLEFACLQHALERNIPVLGICRGAQLINIHFRGTLYRDISTFYSETPQIRTLLPGKQILITQGSRLSSILQTETCRVNALHRQAIRTVGEDLVVTAREPNSVIQAVEYTKENFVIGVQWHPEYLPQIPEQRALFTALADAARNTVKNTCPPTFRSPPPRDHSSFPDTVKCFAKLSFSNYDN